ncbi:helix-turn-helix domain-containing protein [Streptomyces sp. NPDC005355]|uniref:TetR/AcrR family transcriptional regulator n=1 Tax=Streptomyces sp. NPDC005355 TaxID=3157038 RepID=UPI0033B24501
MSSTRPSARKPRTDAARNRARILDTALRHFTERGAGTSLEAIAKDAGVGPATLYRHFPTREDLLAAALDERGDALLAELPALRGIGDPDEALRRWLLALENYLSTFSGLPEPVIAALASHDSPLAVS